MAIMSKVVMGLVLCVLLVSAVLVQDAEASMVGHGAMQRDTFPGCSKRHPSNVACHLPIANDYRRDCEPGQRCRHQEAPKFTASD
ncbi:hypothetical protein JHK82_037646 [Glycine max]|nr:hypothetical protein JHK85_038398 [Glycine max]KAG4978370.1 hypothetical protein JHK86_037844 [Glycine max]KAG5114377.1 hypothetical protein JHK82_037646 [Glycine max]